MWLRRGGCMRGGDVCEGRYGGKDEKGKKDERGLRLREGG